jgi:DNA-binding MarR family transcriptional regulator
VAENDEKDPIAEAHRIWNEQGWDAAADGLAAVSSIVRVHQMLMRQADRVLAPLDLTFSRYEALAILYFDPESSMPLARLGKQMQVHQTSITNLVDKLEGQGLVERTPHPTDRRSTIARITPGGRSMVRKAIKRLNSELFEQIALAPDEVKQLVALLSTLRTSWGDFTLHSRWGGEAGAAGADLDGALPA